MADEKISESTEKVTLVGDDLIPIVDSVAGDNKHVKAKNLNSEISTWYVHATSGSDSNPGTPKFPFTLRQFAIDQTSEGDQIFLRGRPFSNTEVLTISTTIAILGISRSSAFTNITGAIILDTSSNAVTLRVENVSLNCTTTGFTKSGGNDGNVEFRNIQLTHRGDCIFDDVDIRNSLITRVTGNDLIINGNGTIANTFITDNDLNFNGTSLTLQDVILDQDLIINSGTVILEGGTVIKGTISGAGTLVDNRKGLGTESIKTLATGVIASLSDRNLIIAAQTGTADDMIELTGLTIGDDVLLRADAGDTITVKHNDAGATIKILITADGDLVLDEDNPLRLTLVSTNKLCQNI